MSENVDLDDISSDDESTEKCSKNVDLDDISSDDLESPEKCSKVKKNLHFKAIFPYFDVPQVIFMVIITKKLSAIKYKITLTESNRTLIGEGETKYINNLERYGYVFVKVLPVHFDSASFDPKDRKHICQEDGLFHMHRQTSRKTVPGQYVPIHPQQVKDGGGAYPELNLVFQDKRQEINGIAILKAKFALKDGTIVPVSYNDIYEVVSTNERLLAITKLVSPFKEDNDCVRVIVIPYDEEGCIVNNGDVIGGAKVLSVDEVMGAKDRILCTLSVLRSIWIGTPPTFIGKEFFAEEYAKIHRDKHEVFKFKKEMKQQEIERRRQKHEELMKKGRMMKEEKLKKKGENKRLNEERRVQKEIKKKENIEKQKQIEEAARKRKLAKKGFGESITKKKKCTNQNNVLNTSYTAHQTKSLPVSVRSESRTKHIKPIHEKSPNKYQESPFKNSEPVFGKPLPDNVIEHDALTPKVNKYVEDIEFYKNYQELLQVEEELNKIHERKKLVIEIISQSKQKLKLLEEGGI